MRTAVLAAIVAALFLVKAAGMLVPATHGATQFIDDAYYYLLIARHFAESGVPSFDGLHATNGFHPLWMLLLAALYKAIGPAADVYRQVTAAKALEVAALAFALAVCVLAFHRLRGRTPLAWGFVGAALVFFVPTFLLWEQGMESTLATGLFLLALYAFIDERPGWLAVALPLAFLARLDALVFAIAPLALAWLLRAPEAWKSAWRALVPLVIVASVYIAINLFWTGYPTPISGEIKSSFPFITLHGEFLRTPLDMAPLSGWSALFAAPNVLAASVAIVLLALACMWNWSEPWCRAVGLVLAIAALLVANVLLFQRWDKGVEPRYLALPYSLIGFAALALLGGSARPAVPASLFIVLAGSCAFGLAMRLYAERDARMDRRTQREVQAIVAPTERMAGTDVGGFAFWLERSVVNLDGVVNDRELQDVIRDKRLGAYLDRSGVRYLIVALWDAPQTFTAPERMYRARIFPEGVFGKGYDHYDYTVYSYVYDAYSEPIRLCPADEVFRESIGRDGTANAAIVIYRLPLPAASAAGDRGAHRCDARPAR